MKKNMNNSACHILVSDFDYYEPQTDLTDINTGKYLQALQSLPQHIRFLLQDGDTRVVLDENNRVLKLIAKRDPEFLRERTITVAMDRFGNRVTVPTDEELGILGNPEDIYNKEDVEFIRYSDSSDDSEELEETLEPIYFHEEQIAPMDRWDVIYDATEYVQYMKGLVQVARFIVNNRSELTTLNFSKMSYKVKAEIINDMFDGDFVVGQKLLGEALDFLHMSSEERTEYFEKKGDELIYSADWFPRKQDKRMRTPAAYKLITQVSNVPEEELNAMLRSPQMDKRGELAEKEKAAASKLPKGQHRARAILRSQAIRTSHIRAMNSGKCLCYRPNDLEDENDTRWVVSKIKRAISMGQKNDQPLFKHEKELLRNIWRQSQSEVKLPHWKFQKMYSYKLMKEVSAGNITTQDATTKLQDTMERLYNIPEEDKHNIKLTIQPTY